MAKNENPVKMLFYNILTGFLCFILRCFVLLFPDAEISNRYIAEFQHCEVQIGYRFYRNIDKHRKQTSSLYIRDV